MTRTEIESQLVGVFTYKGLVATMADLPNAPNTGDVYFVNSENSSFAYNGASWDNIGGSVDLSEYQKIEDNLLNTDNKIIPAAINELNDEKQDRIDNDLETDSKEIVGAINELNSRPMVYSVDISSGKTPAEYAAIATDVFDKMNDGYVVFASASNGRHYSLERNTADYLWFTAQYSEGTSAYQIWQEVVLGKTGTYQLKKYNHAPTAGTPNPYPITIVWGEPDTASIAAGGLFKLFTVPWNKAYDTFQINMTLANVYPLSATLYQPVDLSLTCGSVSGTGGGDSGKSLGVPIITCTSGGNNTVLDAAGWGLIVTTATDRKSFTVWGVHSIAQSSAYHAHSLTIKSVACRYDGLTADNIIIHNGKERLSSLGGYWDAAGYTRSNINTTVLAESKWKYPIPVERSYWYFSDWASLYAQYQKIKSCGKCNLLLQSITASGSNNQLLYFNGLKNPTNDSFNGHGLLRNNSTGSLVPAARIVLSTTGMNIYTNAGSSLGSITNYTPTSMSGCYLFIN